MPRKREIEEIEERLWHDRNNAEAWRSLEALLREAGDPRAELIAIDSAIEAGPSDQEQVRLDFARFDWLRSHEGAILGDAVGTVSCELFKGYVKVVEIGPPVLENLLRFVSRPCAGFADEIVFRGLEDGEELRRCLAALRRSPTSLNLEGCGVRDVGAVALAESDRVDRLETAILGACGIGDEGVAALAASPPLRHLRTLDLRMNRVSGEGVRALATSEHLTGLRTLSLSDNAVGDDGLAALATSRSLAKLESLAIDWGFVEEAGFVAFCKNASLPALASLEAWSNGAGTVGAQALAASTILPGLKHLGLRSNRIGDEGLAALLASGALGRLEVLDVCENGLGPASGEALAKTRELAGLRALHVGGNELGEGVQAIADSPYLSHTVKRGVSDELAQWGGCAGCLGRA